MSVPRERHDPTRSDPDVHARHVARYVRAIAQAVEHYGAKGNWWDVACGLGYGTDMMPGDIVVGVDYDHQTILAAQKAYPGPDFCCADITSPAWATCSPIAPDVIVSVETLEHLNVYGQSAFALTAATALSAGGVMVVACPIGSGRSKANPWHLYEPTEKELRYLFGQHMDILSFEREDYVSTSGPAVQAFLVARKR